MMCCKKRFAAVGLGVLSLNLSQAFVNNSHIELYSATNWFSAVQFYREASQYCVFLKRSYSFIAYFMSIIFAINGEQLLQIFHSLCLRASWSFEVEAYSIMVSSWFWCLILLIRFWITFSVTAKYSLCIPSTLLWSLLSPPPCLTGRDK